jgi:Uma2 family endonuclease
LVVLEERARVIGPAKIEGAPDLVIEILSPSSSERDRRLKLELYRSRGVPEYWIVDADARLVEQYRLDAAGSYELLGRHGERLVAATIDGLVVELDRVW